MLPAETALSPALAKLLEEAQRSDRAGHRELARRRYESVLYLLGPGEGAVASTILRRIARTYLDEGQFEIGLDCLAAAEAVATAMGNQSDIAQTINLAAIAHYQRGDVTAAETLYGEARAIAERIGDTHLLAMISQNLGVLANIRGDLTSALEHYRSSLDKYRALGMREYLGNALGNVGMTFAHLNRWQDAEAAFDEGLVHCEATGDIGARLLIQANLTAMWIARGDLARASALCDLVIAEALAADDRRWLAETYKHQGMIARAEGKLTEAERHFRAAFDSAMAREDLLLAAETAQEQAELYALLGRNRDTLQSLSVSHRLFTKLRAARNLADLADHIGRLENRFYDVVRRWAQTIESKDPYTLNHCERVADYACALARDVGIDEITMFWFRMGAVLHDVGKIVVPHEVLNKPGKLTPEERLIIERHAAAGSELLRDIDFPWDVLPMVRGHHERWDGTGYPDRLAGDAIPLSARITCVADVFDALTSDRPYRRAFSREQALAVMREDAGRGLDPDLVVRFERLMQTFKPQRHLEPARARRTTERAKLSAN